MGSPDPPNLEDAEAARERWAQMYDDIRKGAVGVTMLRYVAVAVGAFLVAALVVMLIAGLFTG